MHKKHDSYSLEVSEKFDLSGIDCSICPICNKKCKTKIQVCEHSVKDQMKNIDNKKNSKFQRF